MLYLADICDQILPVMFLHKTVHTNSKLLQQSDSCYHYDKWLLYYSNWKFFSNVKFKGLTNVLKSIFLCTRPHFS